MRSLGWRVVAVFVVAVAVLSQGLEMVRTVLNVDADVVALAQYGPALAALVTWLIFRRRLAEIMPARVGGRQVRARLGLGVAACALFAVALWVGLAVLSGQPTFGFGRVGGLPFAVVAVVWLAGAGAEEIGWRGVLQPSLEATVPRWAAAILAGLLWAVWHLPVILQGGALAAVFVASTVVFSVLLAYLGNGSPRQRVIVTTIVHWLVNLAILVVAGTDLDLGESIVELIAMGVVTVVVLVFLTAVLASSWNARQATG